MASMAARMDRRARSEHPDVEATSVTGDGTQQSDSDDVHDGPDTGKPQAKRARRAELPSDVLDAFILLRIEKEQLFLDAADGRTRRGAGAIWEVLSKELLGAYEHDIRVDKALFDPRALSRRWSYVEKHAKVCACVASQLLPSPLASRQAYLDALQRSGAGRTRPPRCLQRPRVLEAVERYFTLSRPDVTPPLLIDSSALAASTPDTAAQLPATSAPPSTSLTDPSTSARTTQVQGEQDTLQHTSPAARRTPRRSQGVVDSLVHQLDTLQKSLLSALPTRPRQAVHTAAPSASERQDIAIELLMEARSVEGAPDSCQAALTQAWSVIFEDSPSQARLVATLSFYARKRGGAPLSVEDVNILAAKIKTELPQSDGVAVT